MNGQQRYPNNTKPNEQERSSYTPPFFVDNIEPSPNNQFKGVSQARTDDVGGVSDSPISPTSRHSLQFK